MAMDFGALMKMKEMWDRFTANHPKFPMFMQAVQRRGIPEGTVLEISVKYPDGEVMETNLKVTRSDLELVDALKNMRP